MDQHEFDFTRHDQELGMSVLANTLGALVAAEEQLVDAELRILIAQDQRLTAQTDNELIPASYDLFGARLDLFAADLLRVVAKKRLADL